MEQSPRLGRALLAVAATSFCGLVICAAGWWMARTRPSIENLSSAQRQQLVADLIEASPGIYQWAYFEPRIGYTLRPNTELSAWGDRFTSNELGYRTGPAAKQPGTFRVVFIGDSWTFGMGVKREETFAEVTARLANEHAGMNERVEAWTLALPGYNPLQETAALWFYYGRLQPDAVVICLAGNDNHSTLPVLPNGATTEQAVQTDDFGDPHVTAYHMRRVSSFRYQERWRRALGAVRDTGARLRRLNVPFLVVFLARWEEKDAHAMMANNHVEAPYIVVPSDLTRGSWAAPKWGHANAEGHALYARMVYRGLAGMVGWQPLPAGDPRTNVPVHQRPPAGDWLAAEKRAAAETSAMGIPTSISRSEPAARQMVGPFEGRTRTFGRATTALVRRTPDSGQLAVTVARLPEAPYLYPLELTLSVPSPGGGTRKVVTVPADGPEQLTVSVELPADLAPDAVIDLVLQTDRATAAPDLLVGRSLRLESVTPQ